MPRPHDVGFIKGLLALQFFAWLKLSQVSAANNSYAVQTSNVATALADAAVVAGDTFYLTYGTTYSGSCATDSTYALCFNKAVSLECTDITNKCTLDGLSTRRVAYLASGTTTNYYLQGLRVQNGYSGTNGGGFYLSSGGASVEFISCYFTLNKAVQKGGAIFVSANSLNAGCHVRVLDCQFVNNAADSSNSGSSLYGGGGIYVSAYTSWTIYGSTFTSNTACTTCATSYGKDINQSGTAGSPYVQGSVIIYSTCPAGYSSSSATPGTSLTTTVIGGVTGSSVKNFQCPAVCDFGKYRSDTDTSCVSCPIGRYNPAGPYDSWVHQSFDYCYVCAAGKYTSTTSTATCTECPAGRYLSDINTASAYHDALADCTICAAGTYSTLTAVTVRNDTRHKCKRTSNPEPAPRES